MSTPPPPPPSFAGNIPRPSPDLHPAPNSIKTRPPPPDFNPSTSGSPIPPSSSTAAVPTSPCPDLFLLRFRFSEKLKTEMQSQPPRKKTADETSGSEITCNDIWKTQESPKLSFSSRVTNSRFKISPKRKQAEEMRPLDLDLCLTPSFSGKRGPEMKRPETASMNSEESSGVTSFDSVYRDRRHDGGGGGGGEKQMLNLFV